jgi:hypothetical protein
MEGTMLEWRTSALGVIKGDDGNLYTFHWRNCCDALREGERVRFQVRLAEYEPYRMAFAVERIDSRPKGFHS